MKKVKINKAKKFENSNDLVLLLDENGYSGFEIGESPLLSTEELGIDILDGVLDDNELYMAHTGIIGDDDSVFYSLVTNGYDEDLSKRYRPFAFVKMTENGDMEVLILFEEE